LEVETLLPYFRRFNIISKIWSLSEQGLPVLEVEHLTVRYGSTAALRGLGLAVAAGEIVCLIGPNGAGKSTLLRCISGLAPAAGGKVRFDGEDLLGLAPEDIARRGLAMVPEGRHIFRTLTVEENLKVPAGGQAGARARAMDRAFALFPVLAERRGQRAGNLSGGEQQQLAISRALIMEPRMMMVDEPSLGLAPLMVQTVYDCFARLLAEGVTLLVVEQSAARVASLADRVLVMNGGVVVLEGTPEAIAAGTTLSRAYFGRAAGDGV
jgi:branched-chain amino acid transport system ATP-binding protein